MWLIHHFCWSWSGGKNCWKISLIWTLHWTDGVFLSPLTPLVIPTYVAVEPLRWLLLCSLLFCFIGNQSLAVSRTEFFCGVLNPGSMACSGPRGRKQNSNKYREGTAGMCKSQQLGRKPLSVSVKWPYEGSKNRWVKRGWDDLRASGSSVAGKFSLLKGFGVREPKWPGIAGAGGDGCYWLCASPPGGRASSDRQVLGGLWEGATGGTGLWADLWCPCFSLFCILWGYRALILMQTSPEYLLPGAEDLGLRLKALPEFLWLQGRLQVLCTTDFSWDGSYCPVCAWRCSYC